MVTKDWSYITGGQLVHVNGPKVIRVSSGCYNKATVTRYITRVCICMSLQNIVVYTTSCTIIDSLYSARNLQRRVNSETAECSYYDLVTSG